jgi:hypothetical protein
VRVDGADELAAPPDLLLTSSAVGVAERIAECLVEQVRVEPGPRRKRGAIFSPFVIILSPNRLTGAHPRNRLMSANALLLNAIPQRQNR